LTNRINQDEINAILWKACDTFRGTVDPSEYKNYILVMLFVKYISDVWQDHYDQLKQKFGDNDEERIRRQLRYERFVLPEGCRFTDLYAQRNADNLGEIINMALEKFEEANKAKLKDVFRNIDFNSEANLGRTKQRNERLQHLLDDFADKRLDLRPSRVGDMDIIGDAYEYLIDRFAAGAGKKAGEFYTPPQVSTLLAQLLDPQPGERICDPACGSGSLLIKCARQVGNNNYAIYAQENNGSTWALTVMNVFLHNINVVQDNLKWADTLRSPALLEDGRLMRFNVVVANPPFSLDKWGASTAENDLHKRFWRGVPPKSVGDYAFISHMIETTYTDPTQNGRVGVVVPHGVLFRGGAEGKIRQSLITENLLDAVIGLPPNLFYGTGIPAAILLFKRNKADNRVLFIDASREFEPGSNQNRLREGDIKRILDTYCQRESMSKYAYLAAFEEIKENDFNLNIPRYVDMFEEEEGIDLAAVQKEIRDLEIALVETQQHMAGYLRELGLEGS
jgi:type I restriction enzyme M protein